MFIKTSSIKFAGELKMKICIAYESKFGNGKKCMEYLKNKLAKMGNDVDLIWIREIDPKSVPVADVYVFSSPTQMGRPAGKMKKFLKKFEPAKSDARYTIFNTYMDPNAKTIERMEKLLEPKGMTRIADGLRIKVAGMKGPCEEGYEEKLDNFANEIITSINK